MAERLQLYNMTEKKIRGDGNCQFRSVADQITDSEVSFYAYIYIYIYEARARCTHNIPFSTHHFEAPAALLHD